MSSWLQDVLFVTCTFIIFSISLVFGYFARDIVNRLQMLWSSFETHRAEEADDGSAVVETTPNLIREKERHGELDTDESQIVTVKSPAQVRADKDRQLQKDIDRETGMHTQ